MVPSPYLLTTLCLSLLAVAQNTNPENGNVSPEDGGSDGAPSPTYTAPAKPTVNNAAGAAGTANTFNLSTTGTVVIIVVCVVVGCLGIASAVLFYVAKKRQWEVRKSIKRASKRVASKITSRPGSRRNSMVGPRPRPKGMVRMESPQRSKNVDLEKGEDKKSAVKVQDKKIEKMEVDDSAAKQSKSSPSDKRWKTVMPDSWTVGGRH